MPSLRLFMVLVTCLMCLSAIIPVTAERPEIISYYDIYANVNGAAIYFDNEYKGEISKGSLTVCVISSRPRPYVRVKAIMDGYETTIMPLPVVAGELQHVPIHLKMKQLIPKTGNLSVSSSPDHAELLIDGEAYGNTPHTVTGLAVGTYTIQLISPGYKTWSETAIVSAEKTTEVSASLLQKHYARGLSVRSSPEGAEVYLDEVYYGITPMTVGDISVGLHGIEIKKVGYTSATRTVTVTNTGVTVESFSLQTIEEATNMSGTLSLTSKPTGAEVSLDSVIRGVTPLTVTGLAQGTHQIKLTYTDYPDYQSSVVLSAGEARLCDITMQTPPASEWLSASFFSVIVSLLAVGLFVTCRYSEKRT